MLIRSRSRGLRAITAWTAIGAAATLDITWTAYLSIARAVEIDIVNMRLSNDGVGLLARTTSDNGATWDSAANAYGMAYAGYNGALAAATGAGGLGTSITLTTNSIGNAAVEGISGQIVLYGADDAAFWNKRRWQFTIADNDVSQNVQTVSGSGVRRAAQDIEGIRLLPTAGTVAASGFYRVGIRD